MNLPESKVEATRLTPKILLIYSLPKVGKTKQLSELENCLILDLEGGAEMYDSLRVPINNTSDIDEVVAEIYKKAKTNGGIRPYKYIAVDTIDKLEEYCEKSATAKFKLTTIGKSFTGSSVLELPNGGGYFYLRKEMLLKLNELSRVCKHLILVAHVKEKLLNKGGVEVTSRDISLAGKLSGIVCAACDAIGYMYRDTTTQGKLMINFETFDNAIMGARFEHLAGKKFEFAWDKIYLPGALEAPSAESHLSTD